MPRDVTSRPLTTSLAATNIRTGPVLARLLPWNWLNGSAPVEALAKLYERKLIQTRLPGLPKPPGSAA